MLRAVVFDIGGALLSYAEGVDVDGAWERRLGLAPGDLARLVWNTPIQQAAERGELAFERFWRDASAALGIDDAAAAELYEDCWRLAVLEPEVERWVRSLRPRYRLATLSNGWSDARRQCSERYGIEHLLDVMVFSAEEGIAKPDAEIYRRTLARLDVHAHEALFLDDRVENVNTARAVGMQAIHVTSAAQMIAEGTAALA